MPQPLPRSAALLPQRLLPPHSARLRPSALLLVAGLALAACQPTVRVEGPREPITINLNVKLDADVRVRLEEKAREDIQSNPDIF